MDGKLFGKADTGAHEFLGAALCLGNAAVAVGVVATPACAHDFVCQERNTPGRTHGAAAILTVGGLELALVVGFHTRIVAEREYDLKSGTIEAGMC
jgi:hypothetical protein